MPKKPVHTTPHVGRAPSCIVAPVQINLGTWPKPLRKSPARPDPLGQQAIASASMAEPADGEENARRPVDYAKK